MAITLMANGKSPLTLTYSQLLSRSEPHEENIAHCAARLGLMLNQPLEAVQIHNWCQKLKKYDPKTLAEAFDQAEETLDAWPTVSKVIRMISDRQFEKDLQYLLDGIRSCSWEENYYGGSDFVRWPEPSDRLKGVLCAFSRGSVWRKGLKRLGGHPALQGWPSVDGSEESERTASRLEKEFRAAWDRSQSEEL